MFYVPRLLQLAIICPSLVASVPSGFDRVMSSVVMLPRKARRPFGNEGGPIQNLKGYFWDSALGGHLPVFAHFRSRT